MREARARHGGDGFPRAIPYRLRVSPRARSVSVRVSEDRGLEVVVPPGFDSARVPRILERMQNWVLDALARAENRRRQRAPEAPWRLPDEIVLPETGKAWRVVARPSASTSVSVREVADGRLSITGATGDSRACRAALGRWLVRRARRDLPPQLQALGRELGLRYREVRIRLQRTRWGSCSSRKSISLNAKLLLLPPALVRSVLIHELCHLAELNHSARFWSMVRRYDPDFRVHRKALRAAGTFFPSWVRPVGSPSGDVLGTVA